MAAGSKGGVRGQRAGVRGECSSDRWDGGGEVWEGEGCEVGRRRGSSDLHAVAVKNIKKQNQRLKVGGCG